MFEKYRNYIKKNYKAYFYITLAFLLCDVIVLVCNSVNFFSISALFLCIWALSRLYSWKHGHLPIFSKDTLWHTLKLMGYEGNFESLSLSIASIVLTIAYPFSIVAIIITVVQANA